MKHKKPFLRITEPDENKIHIAAPLGLTQTTLCGLGDFIGATAGVETALPVNCWHCRMIAGYCQDHQGID
jgi:hypothetical protein